MTIRYFQELGSSSLLSFESRIIISKKPSCPSVLAWREKMSQIVVSARYLAESHGRTGVLIPILSSLDHYYLPLPFSPTLPRPPSPPLPSHLPPIFSLSSPPPTFHSSLLIYPLFMPFPPHPLFFSYPSSLLTTSYSCPFLPTPIFLLPLLPSHLPPIQYSCPFLPTLHSSPSPPPFSSTPYSCPFLPPSSYISSLRSAPPPPADVLDKHG